MKIHLKYEENDFLAHQLFIASKSERIQKKRKRNKWITVIIYLVFSVILVMQRDYIVAAGFFLFSICWLFIYPIWDRRHYINHYRGFIKENYKNRIGEAGTLEFTDEYILAEDNGSESKLLTSEIESIIEIPEIIMVRLHNAQSFVLPKNKIDQPEELRTRLKQLALQLNIPYTVEDNWKWK